MGRARAARKNRFTIPANRGTTMRASRTSDGLTVRAIAGSHVVMLGMSMPREDCDGHMGFAIHRTDYTGEEARWMSGIKTFEETDPGFVAGSTYSTREHPVQGFTWSDYSAKPGRRYKYRVLALKGTPRNLQPFREVAVFVTTESEVGGDNDVFFNRGAAASQEYARRFGNRQPDEGNPGDGRWAWLSRGAAEAIEAFIGLASGPDFGLRVSAYEFRLKRVADALRHAHDLGADVQILYDGNPNKPDSKGVVFPRDVNRATAKAAGIDTLCIERLTDPSVKYPPISHHKFIVLLQHGEPIAVLTGSTNFSLGGVYGQSNVVHVVEQPPVAAAYMHCWTLLAAQPGHDALRSALSALNKIPQAAPPKGIGVILSPQQTLAALDWYAGRAKAAQEALFMTFAFGMSTRFKDAYRNGQAPLRYALLDKLLASGIPAAKRTAAEAEMLALRRQVENRFAVGNLLATNKFDRWVREVLTGLNTHVRFIHTKIALIDPLGRDPVVITGSANFSEASTTENDENMLVIRGNRRVADIYLGEFMRLWSHYAFREWAAAQDDPAETKFKFLDVGNTWWRSYFGNTARSRQRAYFSGAD
jgi:phosphatidylserine/phosphatidylglycerophosphate/cardiolipin synthase-like enzyme